MLVLGPNIVCLGLSLGMIEPVASHADVLRGSSRVPGDWSHLRVHDHEPYKELL